MARGGRGGDASRTRGRHFVVCANALGSCYGTTGPAILDAGGRRLGSRFPLVSVRDQARLHARLLNHLGVRGVALALGASMGGMQALELALVDREAGPDRVRRLVLIGMGAAHSAWAVGTGEAQRMSIWADARWQGGDFSPDDPPVAGLAAARAQAMLTYRTPDQYHDRFGREPHEPRLTPGDPRFTVESYLRYQGTKLAGRFDAGELRPADPGDGRPRRRARSGPGGRADGARPAPRRRAVRRHLVRPALPARRVPPARRVAAGRPLRPARLAVRPRRVLGRRRRTRRGRPPVPRRHRVSTTEPARLPVRRIPSVRSEVVRSQPPPSPVAHDPFSPPRPRPVRRRLRLRPGPWATWRTWRPCPPAPSRRPG